MGNRPSRTSRNETGDDIGTLWRMQRRDRVARCALIASATGFELRVLVDGETLLTERCARAEEAFSVAEGWKQRMILRGWRQIVPRSRPGGLRRNCLTMSATDGRAPRRSNPHP